MNVVSLKFTKMSAGGNDFVVIDNVSSGGPDAFEVSADFVRRVCSRALSVGADGVIVIEPSEKAHVKMNYFNADGGRAALCGNGMRCVARMVAKMRWAPADGMNIETDVGTLAAAVENDTARFLLPLGKPTVERRTVLLEGSLDVPSQEIEATYVVAGVPHLVLETDDAHGMSANRFLANASRLRRHPDLGSEGANVDFITIRDRHTLDLRCFERGVEGETWSSGSGCIAATVAASTREAVESPVTCRSRAGFSSRVTLRKMDSGALEAELSGDARIIYAGALNPEAVEGFTL